MIKLVDIQKNNSVHQMVEVLEIHGPLTENEIHQTAFGYDRNTSWGSNKKYADMLRRGLSKGIIKRRPIYNSRSKFEYYV